MCRDGTVNYFNPYLLVFCRHNHDLKCILSGKSAKAAMFYISDYITKMGLKTYEMLTLLSRAVARMPSNDSGSTVDSAKLLLHKCLSQFNRQQQIHAQQAVRYVQGHDDSISSHKTIPMLSSLLISHVKEVHRTHVQSSELGSNEDSGLEGNDDIEQSRLRIETDKEGNLVESNQLTNYLYRADVLSGMSFFDFCQCVRLESKSRSKNVKNTPETRLGVLRRHGLKPGHPLSHTHELVEHWSEERGEGVRELVPRVIGLSIPRSTTGSAWALFVLAHFKPFSCDDPLVQEGDTIDKTYEEYQFSPKSRKIMENWEAIHECEDERDAERLRKQAQHMAIPKASNTDKFEDEDADNVALPLPRTKAESDFRVRQVMSLLEQSGWFQSKVNGVLKGSSIESMAVCEDIVKLVYSSKLLKEWKTEIKLKENAIAESRRNALNPEHQSAPSAKVLDTEMSTIDLQYLATSKACPETESYVENSTSLTDGRTPMDIVEDIGMASSLNERQWHAFRIISKHFIDNHVDKTGPRREQLTMLMTGPGGTGKTHVVGAVRSVMSHYKCGHMIRFLAPTGSAASLINGMTIHKGLGIKIKCSNKGKGNRIPGESAEDYTVLVTVQNRTQLREEWKNVEYLLIDEASLLSLQLLADIDHALRFAKERPYDWFGGVTIIFAGDFFQYPPVGGTPLYAPILPYAGQTEEEIKRRLGRLAWKTIDTVVTLEKQQRMKDDIEYGDAVQRLRI